MTELNCIRFQVEMFKASCLLFVKWSQAIRERCGVKFLTFIGTRLHTVCLFFACTFYKKPISGGVRPP